MVRGVLGNKCAGQHNLKTVHLRETLSSGNFLAWSSAICVFFCSPISTLENELQGQGHDFLPGIFKGRWRVFIFDGVHKM
jgi:hypothetical protein